MMRAGRKRRGRLLPRGLQAGSRGRRLALIAYLVGLSVCVIVLVAPPARGRVGSLVGRGLDRWEARWSVRVERGEELVASERYAEAIEYLSPLDRSFPARSNRHGLDKERERVLQALGRAFEATDRKNLTLDTYRRLVAFDPRNVANHYALAAAALRFDEPEEARLHVGHALEIHPSHLPSLRQLIDMEFEAGRYQEVVDAYERYLDAFLVHWLTVGWSASDISTFVRVPVDGRQHFVEAVFPGPVETAEALELRPGPFGLEVTEVRLRQAARAGRYAPADAGIRVLVGPWTSAASLEWTAARFDDEADASPRTQVISVGGPDTADLIAAAGLRVRMLKPVDEATWGRVETSYRNLLDYEGLEQARARSFLAEAG